FVAERGHERGQLARPQFPDEPPELGHRLPRVGRLDRQVHAHQPGLSPRHPAISSRSPPPAGGGTWQAARWSSTMPVACIRAYAVVGPTNRKPRRLSSFAIATDSGVVAGTSARLTGRGRGGGAYDHSSAARPSGSAAAARAFCTAASILARL